MRNTSQRTTVLERCLDAADLNRLARRRLPTPIADYVDGGADDERSIRRNEAAFDRWSFLPKALQDVSMPDTTTSLLGTRIGAPFGFSPTGYTRMIHPVGEIAVQSAADKHQLPYVLSTMATTSLEQLSGAQPRPDGLRWFQLYVWQDRGLTAELVQRAAYADYGVLEVAVDTAVSGNRLRDARSGLVIPPRISSRSIGGIGRKPRYWIPAMRAGLPQFAHAPDLAGSKASVRSIGSLFDSAVTWDVIEWLRDLWPGRLLLKGPISPADAVRAVRLGVDGVHLSNHGGRQLDRTVAPIDLVQPVRRAVGEGATVVVDSGFRTGADIVTALLLGADAAFVGRPYLWGLAAGGEAGVDRLTTILCSEVKRTMQLLGAPTVDALRPEMLLATTPDPSLSEARDQEEVIHG